MINDLLDLSRIHANKLDLEMERHSVHELVRRAIEVCQGHPQYSQINLTSRLEAARHHVLGDEIRLQQVFWNLIQNAIKFSPADGCVEVSSENRGEAVCVTVTDQGCGIEPEMIERIFNPFEQGGRKQRESLQGLGLGLAIARRIVAAHGGELSAASEGPGRGAQFTVTLKCSPVVPSDHPQRLAQTTN
jgi:signal transduction histidine kinase